MDVPTGQTQPLAPPPSSWRWLLPIAAFLAGVIVTVVVVLAVDGDDDEPAAAGDAASVAPTGDPSEADEDDSSATDDGTVVRVPAECVDAAELAQEMLGALDQMAAAARDLDARRMQETLDVLQQMRPEVEAASTECRDLGATVVIESASPSASPNASPSPPPSPTS